MCQKPFPCCERCGSSLSCAIAPQCPRCQSERVSWCFGCGVDVCRDCGAVINEPEPMEEPDTRPALLPALGRLAVLLSLLGMVVWSVWKHDVWSALLWCSVAMNVGYLFCPSLDE